MHKLLLAGAAVGALVLVARSSSSPARGGVGGGPGMIPNTQSTYDARTKPGLYRMPPPALADPQWMAFDARLYPAR